MPAAGLPDLIHKLRPWRLSGSAVSGQPKSIIHVRGPHTSSGPYSLSQSPLFHGHHIPLPVIPHTQVSKTPDRPISQFQPHERNRVYHKRKIIYRKKKKKSAIKKSLAWIIGGSGRHSSNKQYSSISLRQEEKKNWRVWKFAQRGEFLASPKPNFLSNFVLSALIWFGRCKIKLKKRYLVLQIWKFLQDFLVGLNCDLIVISAYFKENMLKS